MKLRRSSSSSTGAVPPELVLDVLQEPFGGELLPQTVRPDPFVDPAAHRGELQPVVADVVPEGDLLVAGPPGDLAAEVVAEGRQLHVVAELVLAAGRELGQLPLGAGRDRDRAVAAAEDDPVELGDARRPARHALLDADVAALEHLTGDLARPHVGEV